jgi:fluoroquinolone transport system ATP-binding protein
MITVKHLSYTYPKASTPTIHDLDFAIGRGEVFGFLGPSGAGKSTTQKILIGLLKSYSGRVEVLGREVSAWGSEYYERIGVSFELPNHFGKLTAIENLRYFAALYSRPTRSPQEVLELVGLGDDGATRVANFSKGMQNRLNVARSLLHRPEILFLDEPTSGLDPLNARRIKDVIRAQRDAGTTIVLTTHNMSVAEEVCDRVAFIMDGAIRLIDTPRSLKLRYGVPTVRVEYAADHRTVAREFKLDGIGSDCGFLDLLRSHPIQTIHTQEATLDDIFVRVTGRSLT